MNGSLFSVRAMAPSYIKLWRKGWENVAYCLLGGCKSEVEGVDLELCAPFLESKPKRETVSQSPLYLERAQLEGKSLLTRKDKARVQELNKLVAEEMIALQQKFDEKFRAWTQDVLSAFNLS